VALKGLKILIPMLVVVLAAPLAWAKKPVRKKPEPGCPAVEVRVGQSACYRLLPGGPHGRCEPQSLPYARCRSGVSSCRGNSELSPIGWYQCEDSDHHVATEPSPGCVLILGNNANHRINTGHAFFVEKCRCLGPGRHELSLSHTNHDRRCSIETGVLAEYDQKSKTLTMKTGAWRTWGKDLKALGFIVK
jgi:hypothetical protein